MQEKPELLEKELAFDEHTEALLAAVNLAAAYQEETHIISDSQTLVSSLVAPQDQWPWEVAAVLARILQALVHSPNVTIRKASRSEVKEADRIARRMRDGELPPDWLSEM
ncbi:hypothetical protein LINPERHAP2_LOCUS30264 [Linum perenne]